MSDIKFETDGNFTKLLGHTYNLRELIKAFGGKWEADEKVWKIPSTKLDSFKSNLDRIIEEETLEKKHLWIKACNRNGMKFCAKTDPKYPLVKKTFIHLMNERF